MKRYPEDPLLLLMKQHPVGYFCVMFLLALAVGTVLFDFVEVIDKTIVPAIKTPRYLAAIVFALGAHVGLAWRRKKRSQNH